MSDGVFDGSYLSPNNISVVEVEAFESNLDIFWETSTSGLIDRLNYLIENNIKDKGEYQLTNALEALKQKGTRFVPGQVKEWLDCGNYTATVYTNQRVLEFIKDEEKMVADSVKTVNSLIIEPCLIGDGVEIDNSKSNIDAACI